MTILLVTVTVCLMFCFGGKAQIIPIILRGINHCGVHFAAVTVLAHWPVSSFQAWLDHFMHVTAGAPAHRRMHIMSQSALATCYMQIDVLANETPPPEGWNWWKRFKCSTIWIVSCLFVPLYMRLQMECEGNRWHKAESFRNEIKEYLAWPQLHFLLPVMGVSCVHQYLDVFICFANSITF